jgi:hypothetical protein
MEMLVKSAADTNKIRHFTVKRKDGMITDDLTTHLNCVILPVSHGETGKNGRHFKAVTEV